MATGLACVKFLKNVLKALQRSIFTKLTDRKQSFVLLENSNQLSFTYLLLNGIF